MTKTSYVGERIIVFCTYNVSLNSFFIIILFIVIFSHANIKDDLHLSCSYRVQVTANVLGTLQFQTSKPDVLIRLSILDQEKEVAGVTGKGHVVIPAFHFLATVGEQSFK